MLEFVYVKVRNAIRKGMAGLPAAVLMFASARGAVAADANAPTHVIEHIKLRTGFEYDCVRHESVGDKVRLYMTEENYIDVAAAQVANVETVTVAQAAVVLAVNTVGANTQLAQTSAPMTQEQLHPMLAEAGVAHNIDADLLWSVVKAESAGNPRAVSRVGAQGLMQLMPGTATQLGVKNSFAPKENIAGGAAYLDQLLLRYHDDMALALAAYNAGPEAVDRYHGIPPYRETRAYVARVIGEFNRRKRAALSANNANAMASVPVKAKN